MKRVHGRVLAFLVAAATVVGTIVAIASSEGLVRQIGMVVAALLLGGAIGYLLGVTNREPSRLEAVPRRPAVPFHDELGDAKTIWCSWHSGSVKAAQGDFLKRDRSVRLVLTKPDSRALRELEKVGNQSATDMSTGIRALTADATEKGKEVGWFDGPIGNSMTIVDPDTEAAWARIEVLIPFTDPQSRPSILVRRAHYPELFADVRAGFEALMKGSDRPEAPAAK